MSKWGRLHVFTLITGFVIGAGILGLPIKFGTSRIGFVPGSIMLLISAAFQIITALYIIEALINLSSFSELPDCARAYLGTWAKVAIYLGVLIYLLGALTAYLMFGGISLEALTGGLLPYTVAVLIYWLIGSVITYLGAKSVGLAEIALVMAFMVLLLLNVGICVGSPYFSTENLAWANWDRVLEAFGISLFAYSPHFAIPSAIKNYRGKVSSFSRMVVLGILVPGLAYILWTLGFLGVISPSEFFETFTGAISGIVRHGLQGLPAPVAVSELGKLGYMWVLGYVFGYMTTMTSYIAASFSLSEINKELLRGRAPPALTFWVLTVLPPLVLSLTGLETFEEWLSFAGSVGASLFTGIIPALIAIKLRRVGRAKLLVPGGKSLAHLALAFYIIGTVWYVLHDTLGLI